MQIVINIDEDTYKDIKRGKIYTSVRDVPQESVLAIANGTPLPDGAEILTKEAYSDLCLRASNAVTDAVDRVTIKEYLESFGKVKTEQEPCDDCISRQAVIEITAETGALETQARVKALPPVTPQPMSGYISIDDAMSAFDDFMCNDIEPEWQEVFLELLKDRAERAKNDLDRNCM